MQLELRRASESDLLLVFEWINDPIVRNASYQKDPIPIENHSRWFKGKLRDENCFYFILEADGKEAGQIRFDKVDNTFHISYLIAGEHRGKQLGYRILALGENALLDQMKDTQEITLAGYVMKKNIASIKAFLFNKYEQEDVNDVQYPDSFRFNKKIKWNLQ